MVKTHAWHSGVENLGGEWRSVPPLFSDETIYSWLLRIAFSAGCDPLALTADVWPKWRCWALDIDRNITYPKLVALSKKTGANLPSLANVLLRQHFSRVSSQALKEHGTWPWLLALGARNRSRKYGLQVCTCCLREKDAYLDISWRAAWVTFCDKHKCFLVSECAMCGAEISPHRVSAGDRINCCWFCRHELISKTEYALSAEINIQKQYFDALSDGGGWIWGEYVDTVEWFETRRFLCSMVQYLSKSLPLRVMAAFERLGLSEKLKRVNINSREFEYSHILERYEVLLFVHCLLQVNSRDLLSTLDNAGVTREAILSCVPNATYTAERVFGGLPNTNYKRWSVNSFDPPKPRTKKKVKEKMRALARRVYGVKTDE